MIVVGRFCITGDWDKTPAPPGLLQIKMPPLGHVFGGGWHAVTQAALLALPDFITPGCSFAEIGAGSGILSVAAKLLGAGKCYATEMEPDALKAAAKVFSANAVDVKLINGTFPPEHVDVALVSISDDWAKENRNKIKASKVLVATNDNRIEDWT